MSKEDMAKVSLWVFIFLTIMFLVVSIQLQNKLTDIKEVYNISDKQFEIDKLRYEIKQKEKELNKLKEKEDEN